MKILKSAYSFYNLPETERVKMVGTVFTTECNKNVLYFPIQLEVGEFNYGVQQGLIIITPILKSNTGKWWRVAAKSPDDLDRDLDFSDTSIRQDVIEYLRKMNKINRTYLGILKDIQNYFCSGEISS